MKRSLSKKPRPTLPIPILTVFLLSLIYWSYLALTTRMLIVHDAIGYEALGRMLAYQGWLPYLTTGPNREPLYPLLIAASLHIENMTGITFLKIMAVFGIIIMFISQILMYRILCLLNVRKPICAIVLIYMAISPALNNAAFSLFSEIAVFPIVLGIILSSVHTWKALYENDHRMTLLNSALLGVLLVLATLVKAIFECITPVYLFILLLSAILKSKKIILPLLGLVIAAGTYYVPIVSYKWLNLHYNGTFTVTNRGAWLIYGNAVRDTQPMTSKKWGAGLASVAGDGVCKRFFKPDECYFWSFQRTDQLGGEKVQELNRQHLSGTAVNSALVHSSVKQLAKRPTQFVLLTVLQGLKMFFWESTKIGFVSYPPCLQKIYSSKFFDNTLRLCMSLLSFFAVLFLWGQGLAGRLQPASYAMGLLIFIYIFFFSFVTILTRYALPIAPLYLIAIGLWLNQILSPKKTN